MHEIGQLLDGCTCFCGILLPGFGRRPYDVCASFPMLQTDDRADIVQGMGHSRQEGVQQWWHDCGNRPIQHGLHLGYCVRAARINGPVLHGRCRWQAEEPNAQEQIRRLWTQEKHAESRKLLWEQ